MAAQGEHRRLILHNFLSLQECKELEFIHKSCSTVGYRPNVFSTTLSHLIATNSSHLLIPFVPIRERLREKVEEFFGCEYQLFVEFTAGVKEQALGGIVMTTGHTLNSGTFRYRNDFSGGLFHFQDGEPPTVVPLCGDVVIYTADDHNVHSVDEIIDGERLTLALWFSRDSSHDEDAKLISILSEKLLHVNVPSWLPLPASSNMYWFSPGKASEDQLGFDICWARLHVLGFDVLYSEDESCILDISELLMQPMRLCRGDELLDLEYVNILHALQVVQFYCWKASELQTTEVEVESSKMIKLSRLHQERIRNLKSLFSKDDHLAEMVFSRLAFGEHSFDCKKFAAASARWEDYVSNLYEELLRSLPYWTTRQSIFSVPFDEE